MTDATITEEGQTTTTENPDAAIGTPVTAEDTSTNDAVLGGATAEEPGSVATAAVETATGAPEAYAEFELPEGVTVDAPALEKMKADFKALNLTQDQAQQLVTREATKLQAGEAAQVEALNQLRQDWLTSANTDTEIGGDAFQENVSSARLAVSKFGTPALNQFLAASGIGNHPEVIRVFARIGKTLREDRPDSSNSGGGTPEKKDRAATLYPQQSQAAN